MADSRRKESGFLESTGTFLKEKSSGKLTLLISILSEKVFCDEGWRLVNIIISKKACMIIYRNTLFCFLSFTATII
ncbi:hypothetical protein ASG97_00855 [Bacillus sp. Soil745]|nr:hypothetical protein ASG97_00855 [Bacillus sp. Soil745]PAW31063.1 hypothetical protein BKC07_01560 [Peribacillus simplex]